MQPSAFGSGLIGPDHAESVATVQTGVIQVRAVLDAQHGLLCLHAPYRTFAVGQKNFLHGNSGFVRVVYQPVVSLHRRPVSFSHTAEGAIRFLRLCTSTVHKSATQSLVAQRRASEFLFRPLVCTETVGDLQSTRAAVCRQAQLDAKVLLKRVKINVLDRFGHLPMPVLTASALSAAHAHPIRCPKAGARKTAGVHKAFHQPRTEPESLLEIAKQLAHDEAPTDAKPNYGSVHPGGSETDSTRSLGASGHGAFRRPNRSIYPGPEAAAPLPKPHCTKPTVLGTNQIAKLPSHKRYRTPRMLADHHLVPDPHLLHRLHKDKLHSAHIPSFSGNGLRGCNRI